MILRKEAHPDIFNALRWVASAASKDQTRINYTGVYVTHTENDTLRLVATDGRRLHILDDNDFNNIAYWVNEKYKIQLPNDTVLGVQVTSQQVAFLQPIDVPFPNYKKIIPNNSKVEFDIKLCKEYGNAQALYMLSNAKVLINPLYLDTLGIGNDRWEVAIDDPYKAIEFTYQKDDAFSMLAVVMPMQNDIEVPEQETSEAEAEKERFKQAVIEHIQAEAKQSDIDDEADAFSKDHIVACRPAIIESVNTGQAKIESGYEVAVIDGTIVEQARQSDIDDESEAENDKADIETDSVDGTVYHPSDVQHDTKEKIAKSIDTVRRYAEKAKNPNVRERLSILVDKINADTVDEFLQWIEGVRDIAPCKKWSMSNQMIVFLAGTNDARGFIQWKSAGHKVKKGAKAIYILVPCVSASHGEPDENKPHYFKAMPVFKLEDTEPTPQPTTADQAA